MSNGRKSLVNGRKEPSTEISACCIPRKNEFSPVRVLSHREIHDVLSGGLIGFEIEKYELIARFLRGHAAQVTAMFRCYDVFVAGGALGSPASVALSRTLTPLDDLTTRSALVNL